MCLCLDSSHHCSSRIIYFHHVPPAVNKGFSKDFGRKALSSQPATPGGTSKVVPIASLNPYQSK